MFEVTSNVDGTLCIPPATYVSFVVRSKIIVTANGIAPTLAHYFQS